MSGAAVARLVSPHVIHFVNKSFSAGWVLRVNGCVRTKLLIHHHLGRVRVCFVHTCRPSRAVTEKRFYVRTATTKIRILCTHKGGDLLNGCALHMYKSQRMASVQWMRAYATAKLARVDSIRFIVALGRAERRSLVGRRGLATDPPRMVIELSTCCVRIACARPEP